MTPAEIAIVNEMRAEIRAAMDRAAVRLDAADAMQPQPCPRCGTIMDTLSGYRDHQDREYCPDAPRAEA